jgi:type III secretory pathway component EscS
MNTDLYEVFRQALRILVMGVLPVASSVLVAGVVAGVLQLVTGVTDWSIGYAARLLGVAIAVSMFATGFASELMSLAQALFGATAL